MSNGISTVITEHSLTIPNVFNVLKIKGAGASIVSDVSAYRKDLGI